MTTCKAGDCDRAPRANGLCTKHYQRKRNTGSYELKKSPNSHALSNIDAINLTGDCSSCGPNQPLYKFPNRNAYACRGSSRDSHLMYRFGITRKQYNDLLEAQDYRCKICPVEIKSTEGHLDHDHSCCSGKKTCGQCIRGILCENCNRGLGMFKDNPELLLAAARYLSH